MAESKSAAGRGCGGAGRSSASGGGAGGGGATRRERAVSGLPENYEKGQYGKAH